LGNALSKAIIFDFDGTLVDSEKAIYESFQTVTKVLAPKREKFAKNILIGPPLRDTASEILGLNHQDQIEEFINLFIEMHDEKVIKNTQPYPNVNNILNNFYRKKTFMAIATNKRQIPIKKLIHHFGWDDYFKFIECIDSKPNVRNKDLMIKDIFNKDSSFCGGIFVGDTVNDGINANKNKLKFIKACYGYGKEQDWSKVIINKSIYNFKELFFLT
jgi:phosphoglycolate phosphatase